MKLATTLCAFALLLCVNMATASPTYQFKTTKRPDPKQTDSIAVLNEEKRTVFVVTSPFGIGNATISLASGSWPKNITLKFQYDKSRGFYELEGLDLTTARMQAKGGIHYSGKMPFYFADDKGIFNPGESSAGEVAVLIERRNGAIEATLPPYFLSGSKELKIFWVNVYRS